MAFKFLYLIVLHLVDFTERASLQVTAKWSKVFPDMESAIKVSCTAAFPDSKEKALREKALREQCHFFSCLT